MAYREVTGAHSVPRVRREKSSIAEVADWKLHRDLLSIASDPTQPLKLRTLAKLGARLLHKLWLAPGHAGHAFEEHDGGMTMYNWCGANYGHGRCINAIDCACREHDMARRTAFT